MDNLGASWSELQIFFQEMASVNVEEIASAISCKIGEILISNMEPDRLILQLPKDTQVMFGWIDESSIVLDFTTPTRIENVTIGTTSQVKCIVFGKDIVYPLWTVTMKERAPGWDTSLLGKIIWFLDSTF